MDNTIVGRIFELMKEKKITQKQLASKLGIGQSTVASWKQRDCPPPINFISEIADTLDVSIEYLVTGSYHPTKRTITDDEWFLIRHYRIASEENQDKIRNFVLGLTDEEYIEDIDHNQLIKTF